MARKRQKTKDKDKTEAEVVHCTLNWVVAYKTLETDAEKQMLRVVYRAQGRPLGNRKIEGAPIASGNRKTHEEVNAYV